MRESLSSELVPLASLQTQEQVSLVFYDLHNNLYGCKPKTICPQTDKSTKSEK